ncbi:MAG: glycerophosphodiester phosphodiesterase [Proteobacteria bacterium]|nr:MAG: glycerophosphodiester phosphodiesterase [Pseudomonadota bacterium]
MRTPALAALVLMRLSSADAFDLQGHRGARGLAPENTLEGFATALQIGVTTLELDLGVTKDDVVVVSHDRSLNPDHTRGPDGHFLAVPGPPIRTLRLAELKQYDVGRLKPGTPYAATFPQQRQVDGARIPALREVFTLTARMGANDVRFNIETKLTPTSGAETPDPEDFANAVASVVRDHGMTARVTVQSFDWRTLLALRQIAPDIERACLTVETPQDDNLQRGQPGPSPWTAGLDIDDFGGSTTRLVAAAGCNIWSPFHRNVDAQAMAEARANGIRVIPWTVNERADIERLIDLGVDGLISDYPDRLRAVLAERRIALPAPIQQEKRD